MPGEPAMATTTLHQTLSTPKEGSHHALSCTHCRQRKVKCDKVYPCSHCQRSNLTCIFPERAKNAKKKRNGPKPTNDELLRRLKRMEDLIGKIDEGDNNDSEPGRSPPAKKELVEVEQLEGPNGANGANGPSGANGACGANGTLSRQSTLSRSPSGPGAHDAPQDGLNRFLGNSLFRSLAAEVEGLKQSMDDLTDEEDTYTPSVKSPSESQTPSYNILGLSLNEPKDLRSMHPKPVQMTMLCTYYIQNVDPVFKLLHVPTLRTLFSEAIADADHIPSGTYVEALLFAVYYAAITTLNPGEVVNTFHETKENLLGRYRIATERALANANFLVDCDLGLLQAFVIFLVAVRANDSSQYAWTMFAVALRLAHSIGLQREGSKSGLTIFEEEMRRRLWWCITTLDVRCGEDNGTEQMILQPTFNTRMPLDINDADISPQSTQVPVERNVFTEMTQTRLSQEVFQHGSDIHRTLPVKEGQPSPAMSVQEKLRAVLALEKHLESSIISKCDPTQPVAWTTSVVAQLIMRRFRLSIYHPMQHGSQVTDRPKVSRDELLRVSLEVLEYAHLLDTEPIASRYRWFFNTFVQWHALAATLAELCIQTKGELVERAWRIVDVVFDDWAERIADSPNGMLWRPIRKLKNKAQATREASLVRNTRPANEPLQQLPLPYFGTPAVTHLQTAGIEATSFGFPTPKLPDMTSTNMMIDHQFPAQNGLPSDSLSGMGFVDTTSPPINWAEWDEFMNDYQMDMQQSNDPKAPLHEIKPPDRWF